MTPITIKTRLESDTIHLSNIETMLGKNVEITITEVPERKLQTKEWKYSGSVNLGGVLDNVNIRDFAYE